MRAFALLFFAAGSAVAQGFPVKPVQVVIPFAAGSSTDTVFRILGPALSERLGHPAVVINRPGASGAIGMASVAKSPADGYTVGVATLSFAAIAAITPGKTPFDPQKDFMPVTQVTRTPLVLTVFPGIEARTVKDLVGLARAKPGDLNYGSAGVFSSGHLAGALFENLAGIRMTHIPFSGTTSASNVAAGTTQLQIAAIPASMGFIRSGKVLAIGVSSPAPLSSLPGVPPINQTVPGFEMYEWSGVLAPTGTPEPVIVRLARDFAASAGVPEVKAKIENVGAETVAGTPAQLAAHLKRELALWAKLAGTLGAEAAR